MLGLPAEIQCAICGNIIKPLVLGVVRRGRHELRVCLRFVRDLVHRLDEVVERLLRLRLGRFDHQRFRHNQREVRGRRVNAEVEQALGNVECLDAESLLPIRGEHELVHAGAVVPDR